MFCRTSSRRLLARHLTNQTTTKTFPTAATTHYPSHSRLHFSTVSNLVQYQSNDEKDKRWTHKQQRQNQTPPKYANSAKRGKLPPLHLKDERLPCGQHLDPDGLILPKSDWIHVNGTLPVCSLDEVVGTFENLLRLEEERGIVDLDAPWNPIQDDKVPTVTLGNDEPIVEAAHVIVSPFGRPNGWYLKFRNRSIANAVLTRKEEESIYVSWKLVTVAEYDYAEERYKEEDHAYSNGLVVDDSMVRFENCPPKLTDEYLRYLLARFDLAPEGKTIVKWKGITTDGKYAPPTFVARFSSPAWARAAVREMQSMNVDDKSLKLIAYPKQIRYSDIVQKERPRENDTPGSNDLQNEHDRLDDEPKKLEEIGERKEGYALDGEKSTSSNMPEEVEDEIRRLIKEFPGETGKPIFDRLAQYYENNGGFPLSFPNTQETRKMVMARTNAIRASIRKQSR